MKPGDIILYCGEKWKVLSVEPACFYFDWIAQIENLETQKTCQIDDGSIYEKISSISINN